MNASDADRQIKQMVNFILQEAQEKANEIRIKVGGRPSNEAPWARSSAVVVRLTVVNRGL